jgi:predicted nucleic acid-binding protein
MRAVSNTSPLSNLAAIGRLPLLRSQFSEIWIPTYVSEELSAHPEPGALAAIREALDEGWIRCASPTASHLLSVLSLHLHRGEAEAIALAADLNADVVIIDEQEGRELAAQAGLRVTGVLGILLRAKRHGHIPALKPEIQSLRKKAKFFIAPSLEAQVLVAAGE